MKSIDDYKKLLKKFPVNKMLEALDIIEEADRIASFSDGDIAPTHTQMTAK